MDPDVAILSKYWVKAPEFVRVAEDKEDFWKREEDCWGRPESAHDERFIFPNLTPDYIPSVEWLVSFYFLEFSKLDSKPPINLESPDPGWLESAKYTSIPLYQCLPGIFFTARPRADQSLDVVSLLSICQGGLARIGGNGPPVEPETLRGKYVLLFCVFVPARWVEINTRHLCRLALLSQQLATVSNFEIVIVPKMRKGWDDDKAAFDQLLSPFLGRLVVPFEDRVSRDRICHFLNFTCMVRPLLVSPDHKILHDNVEDILSYHDIIAKAGVSYFLSKLPLDEPVASLAWLLNAREGHPSFLLHNLNSNQTISVAQLSKKLVGLYLFQLGDKLNSYLKIHKQCKDQGLEFEIVLVCMPLCCSIHPLIFERAVVSEVRKHIPNTSWWVLPYDQCACARLFQVSDPRIDDSMITVGPDSRFFVEECGGDVAQHFGIQAYPFNREVVVRRYLDSAKAVTLESLLTFGSIDYLVRGGERVPVSSLRGKFVILYIDCSIGSNDVIYNNLKIWHQREKKLFPRLELVFVYSNCRFGENGENPFPDTEIELLIRPFDPVHSRFITSHPAFFLGQDGDGNALNGMRGSSLVAFGSRGELLSLHPMNLCKASIDFRRLLLENNTLRNEIIDDIYSQFRFMGSYGAEDPFDVISLE